MYVHVHLHVCVHLAVLSSENRYVDAVKPGQYGVPKPFYFPCLLSYWTGKPRKVCASLQIRLIALFLGIGLFPLHKQMLTPMRIPVVACVQWKEPGEKA